MAAGTAFAGDAIDCGAGAARYVDAFFRNIQWDAVERRLAAAERTAGGMT
jgi:hypothetical protein